MRNRECARLNLRSQFAKDVCGVLTENQTSLTAEGIEKLANRLEPEPIAQSLDEYDSDRIVLRAAYFLAKQSYTQHTACLRDRSSDNFCTPDFEEPYFKLMEAGLEVPWFFYSDALIERIIDATLPISKQFELEGEVSSAGKLLFETLLSEGELQIAYTVSTSQPIVGSDGVLDRGYARCEEMGFLIKALALVAGILEPTIYDTLKADSYLDHIYSSYPLGGRQIFFDPLMPEKNNSPSLFVADSRPEYESAVAVTDMHLLGVFEMNAVTRNCGGPNSGECGLLKAMRAFLYSPNYRNEFMLGYRYQVTQNYKAGKKHYDHACKLRPEYYQCK